MPHKYGAGRLAAFVAGILTILLALASPLDTLGGFLFAGAYDSTPSAVDGGASSASCRTAEVLPLLRGLPRFVFKTALGPFLAWGELKSVGRGDRSPGCVLDCIYGGYYLLALAAFLRTRAPLIKLGTMLSTRAFFWSAILFWWPAVGVWPSRAAWPTWAMIPYLVCADFINTALSAVLSFCHHVIYPTYQVAPRLWAISALHDQAAAGGIMWVPGSIAFLVPAVAFGMRTLEPARKSRSCPHSTKSPFSASARRRRWGPAKNAAYPDESSPR